MGRVSILYDGWSLVFQPNHPSAVHLLSLLENHPAEIPAAVALPGEAVFPLPESIETHRARAQSGDWALLNWEQRTLPQIAEALHARLVHRTLGGSALLSPCKALVSPSEFGSGAWFEKREQPRSNRRWYGDLAARLREALISGGMSMARGLLWPADLPLPKMDAPIFKLPPVVPGVFIKDQPGQASLQRLELPEIFILYHGPLGRHDLRRLLDAWSWAAASIGELYPLVALGLDGAARVYLENLAQGYGLAGSVRSLPPLPLGDLAAIYRVCGALFHPAAVAPWGGPLRLALACGKPVVGLEDRLSDALAGPAAYLVKKGDSWQATGRALGAALVTVLVETGVADALAAQAYQRMAAWNASDQASFTQHLRAVYQLLAGG